MDVRVESSRRNLAVGVSMTIMLSLYLLLKAVRMENGSSSAVAGAPVPWVSGADLARARLKEEKRERERGIERIILLVLVLEGDRAGQNEWGE